MTVRDFITQIDEPFNLFIWSDSLESKYYGSVAEVDNKYLDKEILNIEVNDVWVKI